MSDARDTNPTPKADDAGEVPEVYPRDEDVNEVGLPDHDFLGLDPGDANEETDPGDPPVPHGG